MNFFGRSYQQVFQNLVYPVWAWKDGHSPYKHLSFLEETQFWEKGRLEELQLVRLQKLMRHAYDNCPFYKKSWDRVGVHPAMVKTLDDLRLFPQLTKQDIQQNFAKMTHRELPVSQLVRNQTGGSTGEPLVFYLDQERLKSRCASTIRHDRWAGLEIGTFRAALWGHPADNFSKTGEFWERFKNKWIYRVVYLDAAALSEEKLGNFIDVLRKTKPAVYVAYANSVYLLARFIKEKGITDVPRPKSIITSAELLEGSRRELIESVFACPVYNRYGCREVSVIASECPAHDGLHLNAECLIVEMLRDNKPVSPGDLGEVVITDLLNYGMPLIRYKIKDVASPVAGNCSCGRGLPRLKITGGRVTDFITTPEGRIVSGAALTIFLVANAAGIRQAQLLQEKTEAVTIKIIKGALYSEQTEKYVLRTARQFLGEGMRLEIAYTGAIPPTRSGKNLFCISKVRPFNG